MSIDRPARPTVVAEVLAAAFVGWSVLALPVLLDPAISVSRRAGFAPWMGTVVEAMKPGSLLLLVGVGWAFGRWGRARVRYVGPACVATLPIWSVLDMACGSDGHNLFPFEWAAYGFCGVVATVGALWGRHSRPTGESARLK